MRRISLISLAGLLLVAATAFASKTELLDQTYRPLAGKTPVSLRKTYGGDVLLVVNTASKCGFTPQFDALEALHKKYAAQGFAVLGFPSGDFKAQEYDDEKQIKEFCTLKYNVKFPMFSKISVKGSDQHPFYTFLTNAKSDPQFSGDITWNFEKFLADKNGKIIARFAPKVTPDSPDVAKAIESALGEKTE